MKNLKKILFMFLCIFMLQAVVIPSVAPTTVQAATKKGLVKSKGKYYYYSKGKKVKNKWKTVKGKQYYFGSTGAAYKAPADEYSTYLVTVKKIGSKYYAFDKYARKVGGIRTNLNGTVFCFTSTGTYSASKTSALRKAVAAKDLEAVKSLCGTPKKVVESDSCIVLGATDVVYHYSYITVTAIRDPETLEETYYDIYTK